MFVPVVRRASAASRSPRESLPFSTNFSRLFSIVSRARSRAGAAMSMSWTSNPAWANTWAIPLPIVPAPITPTRLMSGILDLTIHQSSDSLHGQCDAVAAAQTERCNAALQVAPPQRIQQRRQYARAAGADRMAERDRPAVHVHPGGIDAKLPQDRDGLDRERFIDLEEVDGVQRPADLCREPSHGFH